VSYILPSLSALVLGVADTRQASAEEEVIESELLGSQLHQYSGALSSAEPFVQLVLLFGGAPVFPMSFHSHFQALRNICVCGLIGPWSLVSTRTGVREVPGVRLRTGTLNSRNGYAREQHAYRYFAF
jgi:hypothetical protein